MDYGKGLFGREEFAEMAETLKRLKGCFLLSFNAVPDVYKTLEHFKIEKVNTYYSINDRAGKAVEELLISNE